MGGTSADSKAVHEKLKGHQRRATHWLGRVARRQPRLFVYWQMGVRPAAGR